MKYYQAEQIELIDGEKITPQIFCFMAGEMQGFVAVQSEAQPESALPDDIPVDIIATAQIKKITGATALNRPAGGQVKYFGGYKF